MMRRSMMKTFLFALVAILLPSLLACAVLSDSSNGNATEEQASGINSEHNRTDEQDITSGESERFELPPVEIPPENLISPEDLRMLTEDSSCMIFDTRTYLEFTEGSIPKALTLPLRFVERRQGEIPRDRIVVFLATDEHELSQLYGLLLDLGFDPSKIRLLEGGIAAWIAAGYEVEEYEIVPC